MGDVLDLAERASRASRSLFESALATVPDVPPSNDDDALPVGYRKPAAKKLATKGVNLTGPKKRRGDR